MIKNKFLLCFLVLAFIFIVRAESKVIVSVSKSGLYINSKKMPYKFTTNDILKVLGEPDRKHVGGFWTYDKLGIYLTTSKTKVVTGIMLIYPGVFRFDHTPQETFKGRLLISDYDVVSNTTMKTLHEFPDLNITWKSRVNDITNGCEAKIGDYEISFSYDSNHWNIHQVSFLLYKSFETR